MRIQSVAAVTVVVGGIVVGCGSDQSVSPAAPASPITTAAVSAPPTSDGDISLETVVPGTPAPTAALPVEMPPTTIEGESSPVRFAAPDDVLAVTLPVGFKELREPRVEGDSAFVSLSFLNESESKRLIVSMTRGQDATEQLSTDGVEGADTVEFTTVAGLRPEGDVRMWTDTFTTQRGLAWEADDVTVIWVVGNKVDNGARQ